MQDSDIESDDDEQSNEGKADKNNGYDVSDDDDMANSNTGSIKTPHHALIL